MIRTLSVSLLAFALGQALTSCSTSNSEHQYAQIDSLINVVNESQIILQQLDTNKISNLKIVTDQNFGEVQKLALDTISKETAFFFSDYRATKKSLTKLQTTIREQHVQIGYTNKQLTDLKKDLEYNLLSAEQFDLYFSSEAAAVDKVRETIGNLEPWAKAAIESFEVRNPLMERYLISISDTVNRQP